ncbi:MAG: Coenzyme F420 hydrogenase/dehydrogenase, beta subunit C-terminal domain [Dehalococcoidia bacterium]|nr:Coenzyme F420 hydrogenase/dehydrogenase, beta subunit C-terminal domain [Dehalococcoidia bacterium]MDH4291918.1 Coenzyme F420 hydrogenase/dehydrogenase, beta subunit C-terminal domain [Dehalococcoidia bacterium]
MPSYEDLEAKITDTGECTVCGACITACPGSHIKFIENKPKRPKRTMDCVGCSTCYEACYILRHDLIKNIEGRTIGWGKKESIGLYRRIVVARTKDTEVKKACQDGGIVTTLLLYALDSGAIDGALVVGRDGWAPLACIAKTRDEIVLSAGSKYGVVPMVKELRAAVVDHGLSKICVVGSPCHIQSIRYLKHKGLPLASAVKLTIGLFCRENYEYACLAKEVTQKGLDIRRVDKLDVSNEFNIYAGGKKLSLPITEVKSCVPRHCLVCQDFAAELADIAIGSMGSAEGWSTVIIRTEEGERIFSGMEEKGLIETKDIGDIVDVKEIAGRKKEKGKQTKEIFKLKEAGLEKKEIAAKLGITVERVSHRLDGI